MFRRLKSSSPHHMPGVVQKQSGGKKKAQWLKKLEKLEKLKRLEQHNDAQDSRVLLLLQHNGSETAATAAATAATAATVATVATAATAAATTAATTTTATTTTTVEDLELSQHYAKPRCASIADVVLGGESDESDESGESGERKRKKELEQQASTLRAELAFNHQTVGLSKQEETCFATVAQLVLPMCTVHGRIELTSTSLYFYADGFAGAGLDNEMAASKQVRFHRCRCSLFVVRCSLCIVVHRCSLFVVVRCASLCIDLLILLFYAKTDCRVFSLFLFVSSLFSRSTKTPS